MNLSRLAVLLCVIVPATCLPATAQDMPLIRSLIERMVIDELSSHDSEESSWYDDKTKRKKKVFQMNFFGREIDQQVASWTEETKSWIWIEQPDESLSLELTQFKPRDGRLYFGLEGRAKLGFRVYGRIQRLAKGNASGTVHVKFTLEGSTSMVNGGLADSQVTTLQGKLSELQFNNDLASPLETLVVDALNDHVKNKNKKLRRSVEKAIDRVKF